MTELTLFASTFVLVFALGAQSLNVNNGHYLAAAMTSFVIGAGQMVLFKLAPNAGWTEITAFLAGGPFGITASMWAHPRLARLLGKKRTDLSSHHAHIDRLEASLDAGIETAASLKIIEASMPPSIERGKP